jgi:acetyl-CoA acetyltransferase
MFSGYSESNEMDSREVDSMGLKDKYAIVGIGYTPRGCIARRTSLNFHLEACTNAVADAGLRKEDIDGMICYRVFSPASNEGPVTPYLVAKHLGLSPVYLSHDVIN